MPRRSITFYTAVVILSAFAVSASATTSPAKRKIPSLNIPNIWGRQSEKKKSEPDDSKNKEATNDNISDKKEEIDVTKDDDDKSENEEEEEEDANDDKPTPEDDELPPQSSKNQTLFINMMAPPPTSPMAPRPMQYYIPQHQQSAPIRNNPPPSLLSTLLGLLFPPRPNLPPGMPSIPGMPPPGGSGISSQLIQLTAVFLTSKILDLLGRRPDAFLPSPAQHYTFERVNDRYRRDGSALRQALDSPPPGVNRRIWKRIFGRRKRDAVSNLILEEGSSEVVVPSLANGALYNRTVIIVDMKPDTRVGNGIAEHLRDTVTFLIEQHRDHVDKRSNFLRLPSKLVPSYFSRSLISQSNHRTHNGMRPAMGKELEVVLFLDSPGGSVTDYGLASSQLSRLRNEPHVTLSVCVDRVAASGGYMMACQASPGHLYAAPFAMLGSIGVLMEAVNVNEVLKKHGVNPIVITAGKQKAALKTLGEVTSDDINVAQNDANVIHLAFQNWVTKARPNVVASEEWMEKVCTGAVFLGNEACELGLVDRVCTSDEYISERIAAGDRVLRLLPYRPFMLPMMLPPGMNAESRAKIRGVIQGLGGGLAPLFRVGAAVSFLNYLAAALHSNHQEYSWSA